MIEIGSENFPCEKVNSLIYLIESVNVVFYSDGISTRKRRRNFMKQFTISTKNRLNFYVKSKSKWGSSSVFSGRKFRPSMNEKIYNTILSFLSFFLSFLLSFFFFSKIDLTWTPISSQIVILVLDHIWMSISSGKV